MTQYIALLRGINLGKRRVKMADLRASFESWGFSNVRSVLASGNLAFESDEENPAMVQATIEQGFEDDYGWEVPTCVRRRDEIFDLVDSDPFEGIEEAKHIQRYVTFLAEPPDSEREIPYTVADGDYRILDVQPGHVISVLDRSEGRGTLEVMDVLEELFGENITTRNWNTVMKVRTMLGAE